MQCENLITWLRDWFDDIYLTEHQDISGKANTSDLSTVATSGSYTDLTNKPQIDDTVTQSSSNAVKSSGICSALQTKQGLLSLSSAEMDKYGNSIFNDDSNRFYSTNDRIYHDWADTDELHFIKTNGDDVNFDDIILEGDSRLTNARTPTSHSHSISNITNLQTSLDDKAEESDLLDLIYPIGSIYMKKGTGTTSICPIEQTLGGTWTRIENRFLYASENGQGVGTTGGSETVTLTENQMPSHTHTQNQHNHDAPKSFLVSNDNVGINTTKRTLPASGNAGYIVYATSSGGIEEYKHTNNTTATNQNTGGGQPHNNMPPYIIVNVWERTA